MISFSEEKFKIYILKHQKVPAQGNWQLDIKIHYKSKKLCQLYCFGNKAKLRGRSKLSKEEQTVT